MRRLVPLFAATLIAVTAGTSSAAKAAKPQAPALQGYCPVAYVAMGKAVKGDPKVTSVYEGHRYLFTNADAKMMLETEPAKYQVAYDGWCATAVSIGKKLRSSPKLFTVHGGKTYLFSNAEAKKAFDAMPGGVIEKADAQWPALSAK